MPRYIKAIDAVRVLSEYYYKTDDERYDLALAISRVPTADVVEKERYDILFEHANILAEEMRKYQNADVPERNVEKLTDSEQRIFLSAIGKEKTLCQNIEKLWDDLHLSSDDDLDLVKVCDEIERKVKKALWT